MTTQETELVNKALLAARQYRPYFGRAIAALTPVAVKGLNTVGVDNKWRLYIDLDWFAKLSDRHQATIICCHEIEHLLRNHEGRRGLRDKRLWNVAGDLEINNGQDHNDLPDSVLYPDQFKLPNELLAEEYFERLPVTKVQVCCGSGAGNPLEGELGGETDAPGLTELEAEAVRDAVAEDVRQAAKAGTAKGGIVVWADARAKRSAIPWRRVISSYIRQLLGRVTIGRDDSSWTKPNGRALSRGVVLPGNIGRRPKLVVLIDTSGSMHDLGEKVLTEVKSIAQGADITEITCDMDAKVRRGKAGYEGGGGTDLRVGFELAAKKKPALIVVISDCETPWPDSCKSPVVIAKLGQGQTPPWAQVVEVK